MSLQIAKTPILKPRKRLSLGAAPSASAGEECNLKDVISASMTVQTEGFACMSDCMDAVVQRGSEPRMQAMSVLKRLNDNFGDDAAEL